MMGHLDPTCTVTHFSGNGSDVTSAIRLQPVLPLPQHVQHTGLGDSGTGAVQHCLPSEAGFHLSYIPSLGQLMPM